MFCYHCEQTAKGKACDRAGVCGKTPEVAALQDLQIYSLIGLSQAALLAGESGIKEESIGPFICKALFSTLTNVNFDPERFSETIRISADKKRSLLEKMKAAGAAPDLSGPLGFEPAHDIAGMEAQGEKVPPNTFPAANEDILSLKNILLIGIKGTAAYADHARILGQKDEAVYSFIREGLAAIYDGGLKLEDALGLVLKCGEANLRAMELLDAANTGRYGHPVPTGVPLGFRKGKAILVSGHDLKDLEDILKQTEGKGIYVYTHGEMLPAHGYPGLKKYSHLYGHYGTAWQNQFKEFSAFPGAILMTTNCIQKPQEAYRGNIFTSGEVGWPGVTHISNGDFSPVIKKAMELPGFAEDTDGRQVMVGFARNAVLGIADKVIEAVKGKAIRHFFLVAGCDGAKPGRNYYTQFAELVPKDCIVLTLACGKFRFFDREMGTIGGIPRLLDIGQCNDAYSAVQIALALSKAFGAGVNELPLSLVLSWYEQKAVAILLTLLALGIKNIRLGPSLPAFVSPNVLDVLVKNYNIKPITTAEEDLKAILG